MKYPTFCRTTQIDGLSIFYREAGPKNAPTILLLHGLPSSSRMFEPLFARLSDRYHLVAPDYPGFGHSDWPDPKTFAYTFDHIAEIMNHFTENARSLPLHPLHAGWWPRRLSHDLDPDRVEAFIVQDAVAHNTGLGENWKTRRSYLGRSRCQRKRAAHRIFCRLQPRSPGTRGTIPTWNAITPISRPTNFIF
jgi:hypothetical protein